MTMSGASNTIAAAGLTMLCLLLPGAASAEDDPSEGAPSEPIAGEDAEAPLDAPSAAPLSARWNGGLLSIGKDITDELRTQGELHRTQREIERLSRAVIVGELGSTLAHELNQPLAAILSNAQAAQRMLKAETADLKEIRKFLFSRMYRAPSVMQVRTKVSKVVEERFPIYLADPKQMPRHWHGDIEAAADETALARIVSDYIAGMTDRFALQDHARLTGDHSIAI